MSILTIISASDFHWDNADHTIVTGTVEFQEIGTVPFTTNSDSDTSHGRDIWTKVVAGDYGDVAEYVTPPDPVDIVPGRVSSRQFGLQLFNLGLMDEVDAWIATQDGATQWAFNHSTTFVREEDMMQEGFTALGFTNSQIDQFFIDASKL